MRQGGPGPSHRSLDSSKARSGAQNFGSPPKELGRASLRELYNKTQALPTNSAYTDSSKLLPLKHQRPQVSSRQSGVRGRLGSQTRGCQGYENQGTPNWTALSSDRLGVLMLNTEQEGVSRPSSYHWDTPSKTTHGRGLEEGTRD